MICCYIWLTHGTNFGLAFLAQGLLGLGGPAWILLGGFERTCKLFTGWANEPELGYDIAASSAVWTCRRAGRSCSCPTILTITISMKYMPTSQSTNSVASFKCTLTKCACLIQTIISYIILMQRQIWIINSNFCSLHLSRCSMGLGPFL